MAEKKVSKLKGIVPAKIEKRLKLFLYGKAGVGKTIAALQFPNAYVIDTEKGTENYGKTLEKAGSVVFQSNDYFEIKQEIETLLTEEHPFKTLIIDPITVVYASIQDLWTRRFENEAKEKNKGQYADMQDFGMRYWGKVKSDYKALQRLIMKLDMNVIITSHQKDVYGTGFSKIGVTFDSMRGDDYFFDQVFRLELQGKDRMAITEKERAEIGCNKFPAEFIWSYENFIKFYGGEAIERKAEVVKMATKEQVKQLSDLLDVIKLPDGTVDKWLAKADVDDWSEMTQEQITKCIDFCEKRSKVHAEMTAPAKK
jgi:GTPase SAR1 family protein